MHANANPLSRGALRLAALGLGLSLAGTALHAASKDTDAFESFESYIKVSGKAPFVSGDAAAYAERHQVPEEGAYGIEDLHLYRDISDNTTMVIDGKALLGSEDYLGKVTFAKSEFGTAEFGYKSFRTFYNGIGGFFPKNGAWMPLSNQELHTDRASLWVDLKLAIPDKPAFQLRYSNDTREGQKDSTIWGDTDFTGIPIYNVSSMNPVSANKKIVASLLEMDERQQNLSATLTHTFGNTDLTFEIVKNWTDSDNTRWSNRYPGELKPYPALSTNPPAFIVQPAQANNFINGFDQQLSDADIWSYTGKFTTRLTDKLTLYGGLLYRDASAEIAGNRKMALHVMTAVGEVSAIGGFTGSTGRPTYSYHTQSGSTEQQILSGNLGITYRPTTDFTIGLALKGESLEMEGTNLVTYTSANINQANGVVTPINSPATNTANRTEDSWTPELDVRYSGIKNLALYATLEYHHSPGDEQSTYTSVGGGGVPGTPSTSTNDVNVDHGNYKVGANWAVMPALTLRGEIFYKDHENEFVGYGVSAGGRYLLGYQFEGYKLTAIVKPCATLGFTARYIGQDGTMDTTVDAGASYDSMDSTSHIIGGTIDWNPSKQVYAQLNLNVVFSTIQTAYPRAGGAANDVLRNADNDYWNGDLIIGWTASKSTDLFLQATAYRATNYDPFAPPSSVSYGAGAKEYTVTAGLKTRLSDRWFLHAKAGYFDSHNETTGGNTDYHGPLAYLSFDYSL
jgi:hypothetical protein